MNVNQPTPLPTRKMMAVMVSGFAMIVVQMLLQNYAPDVPATEFLMQFELFVQALVMAFFGYMTKERA